MATPQKYQATFTVDVTGSTTDEKYTGKFVVKTRLSHYDNLMRDQLRRDFIGKDPEFASTRALSTAEILSQLAIRIVEAPTWWSDSEGGRALYDDEPLSAVYEKAMALDEAEVKRLAKEAEAKAKELAAAAKELSDAEKSVAKV